MGSPNEVGHNGGNVVKKGKWYSKPGTGGDATARLVVGVEWSTSGRGVDVRYRTRWPVKQGGGVLVETTSSAAEWARFMKWGGGVQPDGWEPHWFAGCPRGPSIKD